MEKIIERFACCLIGDSLGFGCSEFPLGLSFELRLGDFDRDDCRESFDHVVAREILVFFLEDLLFASVFVDGSRKCHAETDDMGPSFGSDDIVDE